MFFLCQIFSICLQPLINNINLNLKLTTMSSKEFAINTAVIFVGVIAATIALKLISNKVPALK